jgi:hypothetical protein
MLRLDYSLPVQQIDVIVRLGNRFNEPILVVNVESIEIKLVSINTKSKRYLFWSILSFSRKLTLICELFLGHSVTTKLDGHVDNSFLELK